MAYIEPLNPNFMRLISFNSLFLAGALSVFGMATAAAQSTADTSTGAPWLYNPDANGNGNIATFDLMELLSIFGQDVDFPAVVPAETVDGLTDQVEWLDQIVRAQHEQLVVLTDAVRQLQQAAVGPFVWSEEHQAWICSESVVVQGVVRSGRLESGSARIGGLSAN